MSDNIYNQILTLIDSLSNDDKLQLITDITENLRTGKPFIEEVDDEDNERKSPAYLPRMADLLEWGVVEVGDRLHVKDYPNEPGMLLNKNEVAYDGHRMRINDWAKQVPGWKAIAIYRYVIVERVNQTLGEIRKQAMIERGMYYPE